MSGSQGEGFVVELRRGTGNPPYLTFGQGSELPPTSVGLHGDWRVEANGILDVHAFLYFDGEKLFLQSADLRNAVRVNGKPIGADWSPVEAPCTIAMGDARLVYCPASQASAISSPAPQGAKAKVASARVSTRPATPRASPVPAQRADAVERFDDAAPTMMNMPGTALPAHGAGALSSDDLDEATGSIPIPGGKPIAPPHQGGMYEEDIPTTRAQMEPPEMDGETTRALPLPAIAGRPGGGHAPAPPRPMAPLPHIPPMTMPVVQPMRAAPPGAAPMNADASQGPIAAPPAAPVTGPEKVSPLAQAKAQWKEASLPKKAIALLLPVAFVMVIFGLDDPPAPAPKAPPKSATATSASVPPATTKAKPEPKEPVTEPDPVVAQKSDPKPDPKSEPKAEPAAKAKDPKGSSPSTTGSTKTPERAAIDSVAAGAYDPAAKAYDELAKQHPENQAYREAARILKAKSAKK